MAFNAQKVDRSKASEGVWVRLFDAEWRIAQAGNAQAHEALEDLRKNPPTSGEQMRRSQAKIIAEGLLRGWNDEVVDANGVAIPFTIDNAIEVLADNPEVGEALTKEARRRELYYREDLENQKKEQ